jgi:hypothetical protein
MDVSLKPEILLLTNEQDVSADWVVRELRNRAIPFLRLNTERLPSWLVTVDPIGGRWELSYGNRSFDLETVRSVWYRRPEPPSGNTLEGLSPGERDLVIEQWQGLVDGLVALPIQWVNDPSANRRAESKMLQLAVAAASDLPVPQTEITNDINRLRQLAAMTPPWIIKGLSAPLLTESNGESAFVFTEWLTPELVAGSASALEAPMIAQEAVWPKTDVRVTVVGDTVLAAEARTKSLDWRVDHRSAEFEPVALPPAVDDACRTISKALGLVFAAIDLLRDETGQYFFLEVNPNGEWGWLQHGAGLPIAQAIVDALAGCR